MASSLQESIDELLTLHGTGAFPQMERRARRHHRSFPRSPIVCELLGMAIAAQCRYAEALGYLQRAANDGPQDSIFWENLGQCQRQLRQFEAAEQSLRRSLALVPRSVRALMPTFVHGSDSSKGMRCMSEVSTSRCSPSSR